MKKHLILLFITLCFSNFILKSAADENKVICDWIVKDAYPEVLQKTPNDHFYVVVGSDGRCEYGHGLDENSGFSNCEKWKKEKNIYGECKPFAIGKEIVWKGIINEPIEKGRGSVSFDEEGFAQNKKLLKYLDSKIPKHNFNSPWSKADENKIICDWIVTNDYPEELQKYPNAYFYAVVGNDYRCEFGVASDQESAFNNCEKWKKEKNIYGECKPFAIGKEIVWKGIINEPIEKGRGSVSFDEEGFVLRQDQKSLKYTNSKDDIPGRYLYDLEDVTEDYQVHIIYLLAKDSKDKKWDTKGTIQKIVLKSNKKLKQKINKQFRLDMTKEGKVDVSFVRVDKTKEQINAGDAATYFSRQIIKNGFYHPKKTYAIFYQDRYQREWGQVGQGVFITPKGMIEVRTGVTYLGQESIGEAYVPYIHEMIHALGFVQHCAPCRKESGTDSHCYLGLDIMSENGDSGKGFSIDKKSNEYYGHSNANCQMDMKKSVFLEPTEREFQLKPRAPNYSECRVSLSQKIYNHERALACLTRLDF